MVQGPDLLIKADGGAGIAGELAVINVHHYHYLFLARKKKMIVAYITSDGA